jgi:hypothetical protein
MPNIFAGLHERLSREAFPGSMPAGGHGAGKVFKVFHGGRKSLKSSAWSQLHGKSLKSFAGLHARPGHGGRKSLKSSHAASSMPKTLGPGKPFMSLRFAKTRGTGLNIFLDSYEILNFLFSLQASYGGQKRRKEERLDSQPL